MTRGSDPLKNLRIAAPCPIAWETMSGDDRVRHCTLCNLNVYNFAEMTADEVRELLVRTEGRLCGRLYQRADGTLLTRDCPSGFRALRSRMSRLAASVVAALMSASAFASDGATCTTPRIRTHGSKVKLQIEHVVTQQQAVFAGVVADESGSPIPGVTVVLRGETVKCELTAITDAAGAFSFAALNDGIYRVEVTLLGFKPAVVEHLPLKQDEITRARFALRLDPTITVMVGAIAVVPFDMNNGISTTFSKDLIDRLPIQ